MKAFGWIPDRVWNDDESDLTKFFDGAAAGAELEESCPGEAEPKEE